MSHLRVAARVRPLTGKDEHSSSCVRIFEGNVLELKERGQWGAKSFNLDALFDDAASNAEVFDAEVVPLLTAALEGYNVCLLAYGQTGSGKTHTMVGGGGGGRGEAEEGMIPCAMRWLFDALSRGSSSGTVSVSYCEIHNEKLMDLLGTTSKTPLEIRENGPGDAIHVPGMTLVQVGSVEEVMEVLAVGSAQRSLATTDMNEHSSRSHTIFQCHVERVVDADQRTVVKTKISMVDLAGSEKFKIHRSSSFQADRVEELKAINKSLSCLGACIAALCEGKKRAHVPYRNSKLTRLLQDCLGGNTRTVMIVTLSPATGSYEETVSTLQFADRAMKVQVAAKPNRVLLTDCEGSRHDDGDDGDVATKEKLVACRQEIAHLRQMVQYLVEQSEARSSSPLPPSSSPTQRDAVPHPPTPAAAAADGDGEDIFSRIVKQGAAARELEDAESSVAWLRQYHAWLLSDAHSQYEKVKSSSDGAVIPIAEADKLYDRICMMETSILVQAAELQRAKNMFVKTNNELREKYKAAKRDVNRLRQQLAERVGAVASEAEAAEECEPEPEQHRQASLFEGAPHGARGASLGVVYDFLAAKPAPPDAPNNENNINAGNADANAAPLPEQKIGVTKVDAPTSVPATPAALASSAPTPKPRPKKPLWRAVTDPATKATYYYNRLTKATTWETPSAEELDAYCE